MKKNLAILLLLLGLVPALCLAQGDAPANATRPAAAGDASAARFVPVDVYVDSGARRLAAYQFEVMARDATIVGLEGGTPGAFHAAPYYDPAALQGKRIVVAAFSTDDKLPSGDTLVARLHFLATGNLDPAKNLPEMTSKLVVATDAAGQPIDAKLTLRPYEGDKP